MGKDVVNTFEMVDVEQQQGCMGCAGFQPIPAFELQFTPIAEAGKGSARDASTASCCSAASRRKAIQGDAALAGNWEEF
ncbi:hypothetical protein [Rhizobium binae]|uniref:Uncharacterized protein n=1 Tax=Rhizobium binae TaxID=1138190 RepID=A0ABV2MIW8_9HYPH|nr:hypothetical protein [Rhizobium binae]